MRLVVLGSLLGGCVIPPSLSVGDEDAGVNSPPAILAVRNDQQELPPGEPMTLPVGVPGTTLNLTLLDTDLDDTLYVRMYLDYTVAMPQPARASCTAAPPAPASPQRSVTCDVSALCQDAEDFSLSVVVFDRMLLDSGTPQFQAMQPGGLKTSMFFPLTCKAPE